MPLRVNNGLPHVRWNLGDSADATLSMLFDSGAASSSGYLPCHLWIMQENPDIVASFERFDDSNPFEPIKLGGAVRHPDDCNESMHRQFAAVIRCKTPHVDNDGCPIRISFGLGNNMTVNTILGMPIIKDLGMIPNFRPDLSPVKTRPPPSSFDAKKLVAAFLCGFPVDDATAATFSVMPVKDMHPKILASASLPFEPSADPCVEVTNDLTQGFLQRN
jgi:hypothetical protein